MFQPYLAEYRYYALFEAQSDMHDIEKAEGLFRSVTAFDEQRYEGHGVWRRSWALSASEDRNSYEDYREASAAEVELLRRRADAQPAPSVDLDELDEAVVVLLAARRRAEPVDGHHYFALFDDLAHLVDLDRARSLIRCPSDGDGGWQTFSREGEWLPGGEPRNEHSLPVGREDAGRISRTREAAAVRYFDVRSRTGKPHEIVRRTGSADESASHLGWRPTDVLGRVPPGSWVDEVGERWFDRHRYVIADSGRFTLLR
ncbi:hypothetical protein [Lentzea cavernae]|uniref:Uncharacterized protein n=1 Tax=Lentzea cavernae TaxID=2020703 RepID=A0ABQ3MSD4_9PSEU|nr:hypothetical protein [Lentzea cavernae]GHH57314.1 hypothetical protein GCM10017774_76590 [Lentzea cavernae]